MRLKKFMLLQLFAEDSESTEAPGGPEEETNTEEHFEEEEEDHSSEPEKRYSDEDVDKIIKRKLAEWEKKKQREDDEAKKLARMNTQEKADYRQRQLEKRIEELEGEKAMSAMRDEARKQLVEKGINVSDKLLTFMISEDAKETKESVDSFVELFNQAVNEAVREKARQSTPTEGGGIPGEKAGFGIREMAKNARIIK